MADGGVDLAPVADAQLCDRAIHLEDALVVADLHLGRGDAANLELPVGDGADVLARIETLLDGFDPDQLVLAGDVLHSFQTVPKPVRDTVEGIYEAATERGVEPIAVEGNHDTMLAVVWPDDTVPDVALENTLVTHGHEPPERAADRYVVGHDHPTITIEGRRRECYLVGDGTYDDSDVVMLPAFNRLVRGVEVNTMSGADFQSPLIRTADALAPVVWDEDAGEALAFPPLGEFRHRL
ncbi:metallophosphoesterase [Halobacteriales archaeon Cl-PHB]